VAPSAATTSPHRPAKRDDDDTDARRFYERHGCNSDPGEDRPLLYYYRELRDAS